ncbi:pYEATS domain-containing protein [Chryseolinea sp. T2]|uniref:pYEATS domain-containing protein n=1 Tax=Chryseolinea sp. T2 TaxID=3129255 RepID=UPI00307771DF
MIPEDFLINSLPDLDASKVRSFCYRFVDDFFLEYQFGHFIFAAYASVPATLTPDLLYKLWQNFNQYTWMGNPTMIHRVAVADVLLSPMCDEVGFELYEMSYPIRIEFQRWLKVAYDDEDGLWKERGLHSLEEIADFSEQYYRIPNDATQRWGTAYTEHQVNEALSNTNPGKYIRVLRDKFYIAARENNESDMLRLLDTVGNTTKRWQHLQGANPNNVLKQVQAQSPWMDALKSLLEKNDPAFQKQLDNEPSILSRIADTDEGGAVTVPVQITGIDKSAPKNHSDRKIRMLVVCTGPDPMAKANGTFDVNSAMLFTKTIEDCFGKNNVKATVLHDDKATRAGILDAWTKLMKSTTDKDDIILYIATDGTREDDHCLARTADSQALRDDNISYIARSGKYHSITIVLQLDYAGTKYWLDETDPRHMVFAACGLEQPADTMNVMEHDKPICAFTHSLCLALRSDPSLHFSNRDLFQSALNFYDQIDLVPNEGRNKATVWDTKAPRLIGSEQAKDQFFLRGPNFMIRLQTALFNVGLLDKPLTGKRDANTLRVIEQYRKQKALPERTDFNEYLAHLEKEPARTNPAILLFIFSDKVKARLQIDDEYQVIKGMFDSQNLDPARWRVEFMFNVPLTQVMDFILSPENRGRIQMIYYGGLDDKGRWSFPEDTIGIAELSGIIDHQRNLQLIVSNTCRSKILSQYAVMLGARAAIGFDGIVDDTTAIRFSEVLVGWILYEDERILSTFGAYVDKRITFSGDQAHGSLRRPLSVFMTDNSFHINWNFRKENDSSENTINESEREFRLLARGDNESRTIIVKDDLQKHRWGGQATRNGFTFLADVEDGQFKYYRVTLVVEAPDPRMHGEVAFFLHDTFTPQVRFTRFRSGAAILRLSAVYEAFTVGAMLEDGTTLELDLNEGVDYPKGFYYPRDNFKATVLNLYASNAITINTDLQKNRWGGKAESNNKRLHATVNERLVPGAFKVTPIVSSTNDIPLTGDVAFFVHDSFSQEIQYARAVRGEASITLIAYEDFTLGAYTEDGTVLELDLSEVQGYPKGFYSTPPPINNPDTSPGDREKKSPRKKK